MQGFVDAYAVLGVAPGASQEEVKRAHRALVRRHHPDLAPPAERGAATRRVQEINVAYGLVRDPAARARYDRLRALHRARGAAAGVRRSGSPVRAADRGAAQQWDALLAAAGAWAGRWWARNRSGVRRGAQRVRGGAHRVRRVGADLVGRALWLAACAAGLLAGLLAATAGQRLAGVASPVVLLVGAALGLVVGNRRGWRLRLRLAGIPGACGHRLRGWPELAAAAAALGAVLTGAALPG